MSERVAPNAQSVVVARNTELGLEVQGEAQLPVRLDVSEARIGELVGQLSDPAFDVRFAAAQALERLGSNAAPAVQVIGHLLASEPLKVHDIMLRILENCVPEAQATIPALQNCLATSDVALRINCARTLWVLDASQANTVRPVAEACLADLHSGARIEAASLLWSMDNNPKMVVPALAALLSDPDTAFDYRTIMLLNKRSGQVQKTPFPHSKIGWHPDAGKRLTKSMRPWTYSKACVTPNKMVSRI